MFLENEAWQLCPVKSSFKIHHLQVMQFTGYAISKTLMANLASDHILERGIDFCTFSLFLTKFVATVKFPLKILICAFLLKLKKDNFEKMIFYKNKYTL